MAAPGGLWRITDRATFAALRTGRRARCGTVSVTYLPPAPGATEARVGFQVGKATGNAVVRNRIRRRLRSALRDLRAAGDLPAGTYLVGGRRELADAPWSTLLDDVRGAVTGATRPEAPA